MKLIKVVREILEVIEDIHMRVPLTGNIDFDEGEFYDFDQLWESTALGFDGIGGSMVTMARTYVFIPQGLNRAYVYFGGRFAYECDVNERFKIDLYNHSMAAVKNSGRYKNEQALW